MFNPIDKIKMNIYKCDKCFHIDTILQMYETSVGTIGVIFIDGKQIIAHSIKCFTEDYYTSKCLLKDGIRLQNKFKGGGQSAQRFDRKEQNIRNGFLSKFDDKVWNQFYDKDNNKSCVNMLIICGPGIMYLELLKQPLISKYFGSIAKSFATDTLNLDKINSTYINNIYDLSNKHIDEIKKLIDTADDKLVFGKKEIEKCLNDCLISKVITTDKSFKQNNNSADIILINRSNYIDTYGGSVGIKYY